MRSVVGVKFCENPFADDWMVIDRENPNWRAGAAHDASSSTHAGVFEANSRDHQDRLRDVA
jgi:hypothetical protein